MNLSFRQAVQKARQSRGGATLTEWLVALMAGVLIIALLITGFLQMVHSGEARNALANAKSVRLALFAVSMQQQSFGYPYADFTAENGLAPGVEDAVLLLSKVPGNVHLMQTQPDGYGVAGMMYTEYEYTVTYTEADGNWRVYRRETLIDASPAPAA